VTTWTIGEAAAKCGLTQHTLRWYERLELLKRHREQVRRAIASQRECLKLLDAKVSSYEGRLAEAPAPSQP
jgi:BMFP domain-containing protein YqiC